jgi:muramidase (phage lysozyme)
MRYPRECFSINEIATQNAKREYDMKRRLWYDKAIEMYPNYFEINFKDRIKLRDIISEEVGFRI